MLWPLRRPREAEDVARVSISLNDPPQPVRMPPEPDDELKAWLADCARRHIDEAETW
jgi:hypothetical protein